jgi:hypothetical protein
VGTGERGGAFSAALKICLEKRELYSHYHEKQIIENDVFM